MSMMECSYENSERFLKKTLKQKSSIINVLQGPKYLPNRQLPAQTSEQKY